MGLLTFHYILTVLFEFQLKIAVLQLHRPELRHVTRSYIKATMTGIVSLSLTISQGLRGKFRRLPFKPPTHRSLSVVLIEIVYRPVE